jgi:hypothetical protein
VNAFTQPDLFAGKIHAVLQRGWGQNRIKGRDYYDFVWYTARNVPVHLAHLEQRLRQTGAWTSSQPLSHQDLLHLLEEKFSHLNVELAKKDILPFVRDPATVEIWSNAFFLSLLSGLRGLRVC